MRGMGNCEVKFFPLMIFGPFILLLSLNKFLG